MALTKASKREDERRVSIFSSTLLLLLFPLTTLIHIHIHIHNSLVYPFVDVCLFNLRAESPKQTPTPHSRGQCGSLTSVAPFMRYSPLSLSLSFSPSYSSASSKHRQHSLYYCRLPFAHSYIHSFIHSAGKLFAYCVGPGVAL